MLDSLEISNFKSFRKASLQFGRLNIFIGANGAGKTNLLEAIGVVSAAAFGVVDDESLLRRGIRPGVPRLYKTSNKHHPMSSDIYFEAHGNACSYRVSLLNPLDKPRPKWHFKTERMEENGEKTIYVRGVKNNPNPEMGGMPLALSQLPPESRAASFLTDLREYALYNPNTPALRGLVPDVQTRSPVGLSGGGLSDGLQQILSLVEKDEHIASALDDVEELFSWVDSVATTTQSAQILSASLPRAKRMVTFNDRFMNKRYNRLTGADASEGILYALFLLVLCMSPQGPNLFAIDNVDQALNPRLAKQMVQLLQKWLREYVPQKQLFCTAHNPAVLDSLDVGDDMVRLFVLDRASDGLTVARLFEITPKLLELSKAHHIPLSQLWMNGYIGGVPDV